MPPLVRFVFNRLVSVPVTLLIITATLYGFVMLTPPRERATLYYSAGVDPNRLTPEQIERITQQIIKQHGLDKPYPIQYLNWISNLVRGNWGYSPAMGEKVLPALIRRTPVTAELTIYSILAFIPLGLISGVLAAARQDEAADYWFRFTAFVATTMPTFILALVLLAIFYVILHWFPPDRLGLLNYQLIRSPDWHQITGFLTLDGFLNGRPDISLEAFQHLVLPVFTLSLLHWATLGRVTRAAMIEEFHKEYVLSGKARGFSNRRLIWRHAFRNALTPSLASSALSAATLFTGVFIVEVIFNFKGISEMVVVSTIGIPDAPAIVGFAVYSVVIVLLIMFILDLVQALTDPRLRAGVVNG